MRQVTIWDIARLAGVSISTVSRVLNESPDVNGETRRRVREVIEACGYRPNANARQLKQRHADAVAVIVRGAGNMFLTSLVELLHSEIDALGLRFLPHYIDEHDDEAAAARAVHAEKKVRGVICLGGSVVGREDTLALPPIPCVYATLDARTVQAENVCSVSIDDYAAAYEAAEHLLSRGHRKIAVLGGRLDAENPVALRHRGVAAAFAARGLAFPGRNYLPSGFTLEASFRTMGAALDAGLRPTAVFAMSDIMAIGAARALADRGFSIPDDVSFVGFDGIELTRYTLPTLTTMRQPAEEIARESAAMLHRCLAGIPGTRHVTLAATLVEGASVKQIDNL